MDIKNFKFKVDEIDEKGVFEGYAAVFGNVDRSGDIIEEGAFTKTLLENPTLPILWQHDPYEPIGITAMIGEDRKGLKVKGQLNLETTRGKEAYALLKQGVLKGLSIGYEVIKEAWDGKIRRLKEIKLWEYSLVTFPANPLALVDSTKSILEYKEINLEVLLYSLIGFTNTMNRDLTEDEITLVGKTIESLQTILNYEVYEPEKSTHNNIDDKQKEQVEEKEQSKPEDNYLLDEIIEELKKIKEVI